MHQVALYRKYRPHNFDNLVGQDYIKSTLINAIKSNHISHAYLFSGPRGTGKTSTARLMAKALVCSDLVDGFDLCDKCEFCTDINDGKLIDLIEIDAASNRGIDEVRDLKEKINFAPSRAKYKIYIIDEVHMMTKEAFNALLKTLEEPPAHAYFILSTTEIHKIPETIISRCQRFDFRRISDKALMTRLSYIAQKENIEAEDKTFEAIAKYSDGGLRDAIGLLEQLTIDGKLKFERVKDVLGVCDLSFINQLYKALISNNTKDALKIVHELHDQGSDLKRFIHEFTDYLRNEMVEYVAKGENEKVSTIVRIIEEFQDAQAKLHTVSIPQLPLEIAIVKVSGPVTENTGSDQKVENKEKVQPKKNVEDSKDREHRAVLKDITFDLQSIKDNWPRITERIKTPSSKLSLKNAVPIILEGSELTLQFNTKFHRDKVMEHDHRVELEAVIKELTSHGVKISAEVKELEIKSVVEEEKEVIEEDKRDIMDEALSIFGGEVTD